MTAPLTVKTMRVPGLLPDDALQEQLRQFTSNAKDVAGSAPAPGAAFDLADRVRTEYLDAPMRSSIRTQQGMTRTSAPSSRMFSSTSLYTQDPFSQPDPQQRRMDFRSGVLANEALGNGSFPSALARNLILGPIGNLVAEGGALERAGTLTPEQSQQEAERRAAAARQSQADVEESTSRLNRLREQQAANMADLGFEPDAEASAEVDATIARQLDEASKAVEEADRAVEMPEFQPGQTWWLDASQRFMRATPDAALAIAKTPPILWEMTYGALRNGGVERSDARAWLETIDASLDKLLPGDKARARDFVSQVGAGGGSMLGFMMTGFIGSTAGLPASAGTYMAGAALGGYEQLRDAEQHNATGFQKLLAYTFGAGMGLTEAVQIDRMLYRADRMSGGQVQRMLANTAASSIEEFVQEMTQAFGQDVIAKLTYDTAREFSAGDYFRAGLVGAVVGGVAGGGTSLINQLQTQRFADMGMDERAQELMLSRVIGGIQQQIDNLPNAPETETGYDVPDVSAATAAPQPDVQAQRAPAEDPAAVARRLAETYRDQRRPSTQVAADFAAALARPERMLDEQRQQAAGGTVPQSNRPDGKIAAVHYSGTALPRIEVSAQGTGPVRGAERQRIGSEGYVPRSYYGVYTVDTPQPAAGVDTFKRLTPEETAALSELKEAGVTKRDVEIALEARYSDVNKTRAYSREAGMGDFRHEVLFEPNEIYNMREDPLNLREQLDPSLDPAARTTAYEAAIRDAGFKAAYLESSEHGQAIMSFVDRLPEKTFSERFGLPVDQIAAPEEFAQPTPETFAKGGWSILTGTQESIGSWEAPENVAANRKLERELQRRGIQYQKVAGSYEGAYQGESFLIFAPENVALALGAKYQQESVLTNRGLEFTDGSGRVTPVNPANTIVGPEAANEPFFSQTEDGTPFTLGLDFGRTYDRRVVTVDPAAVELDPADLQPLDGLAANSTGPIEGVVRAARAYEEARGIPVRRQREYVKVDADRAKRIAEAYEQMEHAPNDPRVKAAYDAMIEETLAQYQFVKATGLVVEAIEPGQPDPYSGDLKAVLRDIQNGHLWFFPTDQGFGTETDAPADNPLLRETDEFIGERRLLANDVFRIVHDFFGHGLEGSGFGARGEENAWQSHMRLYSEAALPAVTSETRGQNSWVNYGPFGAQNRANPENTVFAEQKTGIMPEWTWREGVVDDTMPPASVTDAMAQGAEALTGDTWSRDDLRETMRAWQEAVLNPESQYPLAAQLRALVQQLSENATEDTIATVTSTVQQLMETMDARTAAEVGQAVSRLASRAIGALGQGTATSERTAGVGNGRVVAGGERDAATQGSTNAVEGLTPEQASAYLDDVMPMTAPAATQTPEFRAWFGDSKVVDENGDPLVVYHGTPGEPIAAFEKGRKGTTTFIGIPVETQRHGFYFAENKAFADSFSKQGGARSGSTMPLYLSIQNPLRLTEAGVYWKDVNKLVEQGVDRGWLESHAGDPRTTWEQFDDENGAFFVSAIKAAGYDGVLMQEVDPETDNTENVWIAFEPTQIKSVNNAGTFDPNNPDIMAMAGTGTSAGRGAYRAEQTRPGGGVAAGAAPGSDLNLAKISKNFVDALDLTVRQGRLTIKGADVMGQYSRKQDVVRLRTANDLSTLVHEGGHALQAHASQPLQDFIKTHGSALADVARQLYGGDLSAMTPDQKVAEGFAEFFRVYTLSRPYADRKHATLTQAFDTLLTNSDANLHKRLELIGQQHMAWLNMPSVDLVRNMVVSGVREQGFNAVLKEMKEAGIATWMHEVARSATSSMVNRYAGMNDLVVQILNEGQKASGKAVDLKRADDPRTLIRAATRSGQLANIELTDGVYGYRSVQPFTRGLREALLRYHGKTADSQLGAIDPTRQQDFAAYLIAMRGLDEYRRLAEGKIERPPLAATAADLRQTIADLDGKYGADFAEAAAIVNEYATGMWQKAYDAGLMDKETYKDGLDRQFYAPLQRDMSDRARKYADNPITGGGSRFVKRFRGSDRNIIDPMDVLMHKTFALERLIAENEVKRALAALADRVGQTGALVERVPAQQLIGRQWTVKEVARQLTRDDTVSQADAADLMTILEASIENGNMIDLYRSEQAGSSGENIVFFWEKGKLAALQLVDSDVGVDVVNTLNGIGKENMPMFVELIAGTSTAFRASITSWPDFLVVNFIRDQMSAWILTDVGFKPFVTGIRGSLDEIRQGRWASMYNATMGAMGGMNNAAIHKARVEQDIDALRKKGYVARAFSDKGFLGAVRGVARLVELTETGTRLGIMRKAFERATADGLTEYEAAVEASYLGSDYIDYGLNGSRMLLYRRIIPFFNAQIQGYYKMLRVLGADEVRQRKGLAFALRAYFKNVNNLDLSRTEKQALRTGRKAWVKMSSLALISAALHFLFEDDPDYQDASEYLRSTGWVIPTGDGRVFYIPKPFELAFLANVTERALEHASGDAEAKSRFMRGVAMTMVPPTSPPLLQVIAEQSLNRTAFDDREIVPFYMQALEPELQYNEYTSELAKDIGAAFGWSPMRVDHFLNGLGASAYRDLSIMYNMSDPARPETNWSELPFTRRFVRDTRRGATSSRDFWKLASTTNGLLQTASRSYQYYLDRGNDTGAQEFLRSLDEETRAFALLDRHFDADIKRLHPMYRTRQINTVLSGLRREMRSDLGVESTMTDYDQPIMLTAREKREVDHLLSEIARREMRNTLIMQDVPGWTNERPLRLQETMDLLRETSPMMAEELDRRMRKARIYSADAVRTYWPEARDRLLRDGEQAFMKDLETVAKVIP